MKLRDSLSAAIRSAFFRTPRIRALRSVMALRGVMALICLPLFLISISAVFLWGDNKTPTSWGNDSLESNHSQHPNSVRTRLGKVLPLDHQTLSNNEGDPAFSLPTSFSPSSPEKNNSSAKSFSPPGETQGKKSIAAPQIANSAFSEGAFADTAGLLDQLAASPLGLSALGNNLQSFLSRSPNTPSRRPATNQSRPSEVDLPQATLEQEYCTALLPQNYGKPRALRLYSGFFSSGLNLLPASAQLCGTPSEIGIYRFSVAFWFESEPALLDPELTLNYRLVVSEAEAEEDGELRLLTAELAIAQVGEDYALAFAAAGGSPPYRWLIAGLPEALEFDAASGIVAGTPLETGEYELFVQVQDQTGDVASLPYILLVRSTPVFITTASMAEAVVGMPYQSRFEAQGGTLPYSWQITSTDFPEGVAFNQETGVLAGVFRSSLSTSIKVLVTDSVGNNDSAEFTLRVRESSLAINSVSLLDGFSGKPYSFSLTASGGVSPYRWSTLSTLPPGLTLAENGRLSGSLTKSGDFAFSLLVEDSLGQRDSRRLSLRVQDPSESPTAEEPVPSPTPAPNPRGNPNSPPQFPAPENLQAFASDAKIALSWKNPQHEQFQRVILVRGELPLLNPDEGEVVYSGFQETALDLQLRNDFTYYYTVFAEYSAGSYIASDQLTVVPRAITLTNKPDPFVDRVVLFLPLDRECFNCNAMPQVVLGPPQGKGKGDGSHHVVSLGAGVFAANAPNRNFGGSITLEFQDNIVYDGPDADFTIFENAFRLTGTNLYFVEPATVEVSADGVHFYRFPLDFVPHYFSDDGSLNLFNPFCYAQGFAGVEPVYSNALIPGSPTAINRTLAGGDQFDLSDLPGKPLSWIRFIRLTATGDGWMQDRDGDTIRHSNESPTFAASGRGNSGFDLDAVVALNY